MGNFINILGEKFNYWEVLEYSKNSKWTCRCECGTIRQISGSNLRLGKSKSCGCMQKMQNSENAIKRNTTHGLTKTNPRLYSIWHGMKQRCYYKKNINYEKYGGKGITVCDEWVSNFENFYEWSTTHGYAENLTIDRIDNNKGYSPENCRWATPKTQANNRTNNTLLTYKGETRTLQQWSDILGIPNNIISDRIKLGYTIHEAFTREIGYTKKKIKENYIKRLKELYDFIIDYYNHNKEVLKRLTICQKLGYEVKGSVINAHLNKLQSENKIIIKKRIGIFLPTNN